MRWVRLGHLAYALLFNMVCLGTQGLSKLLSIIAGHSDPRWLQAVTEQAATLVHTSNLFHSVPQVSYVEFCHQLPRCRPHDRQSHGTL